ncbi:hypothetical protein DVH24_018839 [Malus domestica]|uniref:Uncharacterized protein n=1 Tax=Malus domestica TaxID=3750 RepID=A0A498HMI8_MALDO|nr:hypothetical protein DVH24_018839 [Malus domestica]
MFSLIRCKFPQQYYEFLDYFKPSDKPIFLKICGESACWLRSLGVFYLGALSAWFHVKFPHLTCVQLDIDGDFIYFLADAAVIAVKVISFLVLSLRFQFVKLLMFICLAPCNFSIEIPIIYAHLLFKQKTNGDDLVAMFGL